jgi:hypothetical protein
MPKNKAIIQLGTRLSRHNHYGSHPIVFMTEKTTHTQSNTMLVYF